MIYYLIVFFIACVGIITLADLKKPAVQTFAFFFFFLIVAFGGLRYKVGADWESYEKIFSETNSENLLKSGIEPLFGTIIVTVKYLNLDYLAFVFIIFFLSAALKFKSFYKYSNSFFAALLIYFPVQFMAYDVNGIRQGLAIAIIFCSIEFLLKRKFWPYVLLITIATGFHYSAIIFFPFYFIANKSIKPLYIHWTIFLSIVFGFLLQKVMLSFVLSKLTGLESVYAEKVFSYSENEAFGSGISLGFSTIHRLAIFYVFYYYYDKIRLTGNLKNILLNAYFISLVIYFLFSAIEIVAARGSLYYRSFDILMIASFITIPRKFVFRVCVFLLISLYSLFGVYTNLKMPMNGLVPYDNSILHFIK